MAVSRYKFVEQVANDLEEFEDLLEVRKKMFIVQHKTKTLKNITPAEMSQVYSIHHLWKMADRYWKLSNKYYNDPKYWWVIAEWNQRPTEALIDVGEIILVPTPLGQALTALGY